MENKDDTLSKVVDHSNEKIQGHLAYRRTPIEKESPEEFGYERIKYNLAESSVPDFILGDLDLDLSDLALCYTDHLGNPRLRQYIAEDANPDESRSQPLPKGCQPADGGVNRFAGAKTRGYQRPQAGLQIY